METFQVNVKERLSLLQLLPTQGSITEMVEVYDLARELKLSDDEKGLINYSEDNANIRWDSTKDPNKEITINSSQYKILMESIDKLDAQKQIPLSMVPLILKLKHNG